MRRKHKEMRTEICEMLRAQVADLCTFFSLVLANILSSISIYPIYAREILKNYSLKCWFPCVLKKMLLVTWCWLSSHLLSLYEHEYFICDNKMLNVPFSMNSNSDNITIKVILMIKMITFPHITIKYNNLWRFD